jgi:hypothetical protein
MNYIQMNESWFLPCKMEPVMLSISRLPLGSSEHHEGWIAKSKLLFLKKAKQLSISSVAQNRKIV